MDHAEYRITFETANTFVEGDLMRCQTFTNGHLKSYWVLVNGADSDGVWVDPREFDGVSLPESGDECVLMGNIRDKNRQNLILISATEDGQPRIDVLDGVHDTNFTGCLRTRLGNLDGITDDWFPKDNQPHGNGLYSDNAYLRGTFLLATGEDIKTKFEIVEGKIESMIEAVRDDFVADKGYLNNPAFASGMEKWDTSNETVFFLVGNKWIWANSNVLSKKGNSASIAKDDGRTVVRIINKYILQKNSNLRSKPTFEVNSEGKKEAVPVYLSFFYKVIKGGLLSIEFENVDKTGFENFNSFEYTTGLSPTDGYMQFSCDGLWNGTGDFKLSFIGEIYLYMLVLSTDKIEALTYKYRTLFEQSEKLIKIAAQNFDNDGKVIAESGILTTSQMTGMYAIDSDGNLRAFVGAGQEGVKIKADHIQLEGIVTANGNFKILEDGSIETVNGKFTGEVNATSGKIGGFIIGANSITAEGGYSGGNVDGGTSKFFLYSSGDGFLGFRDKYRWVGMGLDTMPAGAAVGSCLLRISNDTPLEYFDNYGAYINVSGGRNNIGLLMYGDIRANARGYHSLNGTVVIDGADELRVATDMAADGTYTKYYSGVSFNPADYDLDKVRFQVRNGLIVAVIRE